jgi:hypothetical protein
MPGRTSLDTEALDTSPVFIVGQARSGTSILYRLLQTHPTFSRGNPQNLSESHALHVLARSQSIDVPSMRSFAGLDDDAWSRLLAAQPRSHRRRRLAPLVPASVLTRLPRLWSALGCEDALRSYIESVAAAGRERLLEKTPQNLPWVPHIAHTFPSAKLVCIGRHPVTTLASYRRRHAEDPGADWAAVSLDDFCARWRHEAALIDRWSRRYPDRFFFLRYEQLVVRPDDVQRELFAWLGLEPLRELPGTATPSPFAPPSEVKHLYGPIGPTSTNWRTYVSAAEAAEVEARLATPMAVIGTAPLR